MNIYSIKNEKLNFFNRPIYCESSNEALTYVQNILMSDADRALRGLRSDLALYYLGSINFETGCITPADELVKVSDLQDIFDSIPEDQIPRDSVALRRMIIELSDRVTKVESGEIQPFIDIEEDIYNLQKSDDCVCGDSIVYQILNLFRKRKKEKEKEGEKNDDV